MEPQRAKFAYVIAVIALFLAVPDLSRAQSAGATLSGAVTSSSGQAVANAKISVKNLATGQPVQAESDAAGAYTVPNLAPGKYEVSVSADGFSTTTESVTLAPGASQHLNVALSAGLSLQGLGFPQSQTQGSAQEQARLNKRTHMLKVHQTLGLITAAPMLATVITGGFAGGKRNVTSSNARDLHVALGSLTAGMYFTTAYFAIAAPKIEGTKTRGPIRLHKALAWIHGPGMVLTPILGAMAYAQKSKGERVHGIASAHGPVAVVTAAAYGLALLSVSIKF
ncbi:MAG TPA: carboxypeptidase-like regulatory domain-containing protein [Terriglobales bacterium]|nr:carboxypeptidase-like regulatory domain-containing protein [Terriglobales bacterium]